MLYGEGSLTPASQHDYQTGYIDFWLRFIGVQQVQEPHRRQRLG